MIIFFSFSISFPFPLFSLKHRGVRGVYRRLGVWDVYSREAGGYQPVEEVSRLPTTRRGFQHHDGKMGRLEEVTTRRVVVL